MNKKILFSLLPVALLLAAMVICSFIENETAYYITAGAFAVAALVCLCVRLRLK